MLVLFLCVVALGLRSPEALKSMSAPSRLSPSVFPVRALWMMTFITAHFTGSPFNWIKTGPLGLNKRGHWLRLMSELGPCCSLSDEDRATSGQSPSIQNSFGMQALPHSVAFFVKKSNDAAKKERKGRKKPVGTATDMISNSPTLVAMEICSICSVT